MRTCPLLSIICCLSFIITPASAQSDLQNYKMAGPYEVVARDGEFRASKGGSERAGQSAPGDAHQLSYERYGALVLHQRQHGGDGDEHHYQDPANVASLPLQLPADAGPSL